MLIQAHVQRASVLAVAAPDVRQLRRMVEVARTLNPRIETLLQLSGSSVALMYAGLLVLLIGGVIAGFAGQWWSFGWIWLAIGLLVMISGVMMGVASPYYRRVKEAVKLRPSGVPRVSDEELDELLQARAPIVSGWLGVATLAAIVWLMVWKPF